MQGACKQNTRDRIDASYWLWNKDTLYQHICNLFEQIKDIASKEKCID